MATKIWWLSLTICAPDVEATNLDESRVTHGLDLSNSYMVGDRDVDVMAGRRAVCKTVLVGNATLDEETVPDARCTNLLDAVFWILEDAQHQALS